MSNISISACVLTYNGKDRIIPTLESLKLQTYPHKELIIADDASTDSGYTVSVIERWLKNNSEHFTNVQFIKNFNNLGIVANIKNAVSYAKGEIIFLLGQGDMCYGPDTFSQIAEEIEKQRNNGLEDPYFWLGYYKSFSIENGKIKPVQLYRNLPFQHNLVINNPHKALKIHIKRPEIGGVGMVYSTNFYKEENYPLNYAPKNLEDWTALTWAMVEGHRIGSLPLKLRWYEVGVGISWPTKKQFKNGNFMNLFKKAKEKLSPNYINPNSNKHQATIYWLKTLDPKDNRMENIINDHINFLELNTQKLNLYLLIILLIKHIQIHCYSILRKYYLILIFNFHRKEFYVQNKPFSNETLKSINNLR